MQPKISVLTSVYQAEPYLEKFITEITAQSVFPESEFVLVANQASKQERSIIEDFRKAYPEQVQVHYVKVVESLGASWNRAWKAASAKYVALWNVDDRRRPKSLEMQIAALDAHEKWQICYGDYIRVSEYGGEKGIIRKTPDYAQSRFRRSFPQGGAFWVMRKSIGEQIGYFDEQFQIGPDLDFSIRMAEANYEMGRVDHLLGYFTDIEAGLSTREGGQKSAVERTAIQLRYGIFDKVRWEYQEAAKSYHLKEILNFNSWKALDDLLPEINALLKKRKALWVFGVLRNSGRWIIRKLGLLDQLYSLQKRFTGREL